MMVMWPCLWVHCLHGGVETSVSRTEEDSSESWRCTGLLCSVTWSTILRSGPILSPHILLEQSWSPTNTHTHTQRELGWATNTHKAETWLSYSNQIEAKFDLCGGKFCTAHYHMVNKVTFTCQFKGHWHIIHKHFASLHIFIATKFWYASKSGHLFAPLGLNKTICFVVYCTFI